MAILSVERWSNPRGVELCSVNARSLLCYLNNLAVTP